MKTLEYIAQRKTQLKKMVEIDRQLNENSASDAARLDEILNVEKMLRHELQQGIQIRYKNSCLLRKIALLEETTTDLIQWIFEEIIRHIDPKTICKGFKNPSKCGKYPLQKNIGRR